MAELSRLGTRPVFLPSPTGARRPENVLAQARQAFPDRGRGEPDCRSFVRMGFFIDFLGVLL